MDEETTALARDMAARLFALQAGLIAIIRTHPNPKDLRAALEQAEDAGMSNMLYLFQDEHLQVYRNTVRVLSDQIPPPHGQTHT